MFLYPLCIWLQDWPVYRNHLRRRSVWHLLG